MLNLEPNITNPDDIYQSLIDAHRGLTDEQSMALNARIVLILSNHIGNSEVLNSAFSLARSTLKN
jgi:Protein of unknown function (DUF2783)